MKSGIPIYDICTITDVKDDEIIISRFSEYSENYKHLHLPHKHNFYHVVFFTEGRGNHTIDFEKFDVKSNQIYFMVPGQVHSWNFEGTAEGYIINFSASFYQSFLLRPDYLEQFFFFGGNAKESVIDVPKEIQQQITDVFECILAEAKSNSKMKMDIIRTFLLQIFLRIAQLGRENTLYTSENNYNYTLLNNFKKLIELNYNKLKLPKEYAALLYITPNHLNALCQDILGISAGELIRNRIILEAKRLLINMDLSISEIAYRLNFSDNSYFTKFFKKHVDITPEEFRKKN